MKKNNAYYSFFAEALMSYLNLIYLDNKLTFGVIAIDETITDQHTGVDSCMYSDQSIILGEAKFYKSFNAGKNKIINDFNDNSLISKIKSFYQARHVGAYIPVILILGRWKQEEEEFKATLS